MTAKIALEEHFVTPELEHCIAGVGWDPAEWRRVLDRLEDVDRRLEVMDENGVEIAVLSLGSDGIQGLLDPAEAIDTARRANDALAQLVHAHPTRFGGFAALPMQDPAAAQRELTRSVTDLGLKGALVNGYSNLGDPETGLYYDAAEYEPFWRTVAELEVPIYLHPRNPLPGQRHIYEGREELLGPTWAFAVETGTHALRLITSGLFDRVPGIQIILGHLGEQLPFAINRLEQRLSHNPRVHLDKPPSQALREHFYITTSGNNHTPSLKGVIEELGSDRVMFAADYPFEKMEDGARWFDGLEHDLGVEIHRKIARENAIRVLDPS
jgi:predicted TIM-barrel fold metal-dependent hydrolase